MRRILFLVCVCLWWTTVLLSQGTPAYTVTRLDGSLYESVRVDGTTALVTGAGGIVLCTKDKGVTWSQVLGIPGQMYTGGTVLPDKTVLLFGAIGSIISMQPPYTRFTRLPVVDNQTQRVKQGCAVTQTHVLCIDQYGMAQWYQVGDTLMRPVPSLAKYNVRCLARLRTGVLMAGTTEGVIRSLDSGETWTLVRSEKSSQNEVIYAHVTDADTAIFGFCDVTQTTQRLHITGDSGKTWKVSPVLNVVGPVLWYGSNSCQIFDRKGVPSTMLMYRVARVEYLHLPISRTVWSVADTSRYMADATASGFTVRGTLMNSALAFDGSVTIMMGMNKTLYRSTDGGRTFALRSHISDPTVLLGSDFGWTRMYDDSTISWAGPQQRYSSSTDGGVTWMPRKYPADRTILPFNWRTSIYRMLSPTCYIAGSEYRRYDITTDGGETFRHPALYEFGNVFLDLFYTTEIRSVDSVIRINGDGVFLISDSCRVWTKVGDLGIGQTYDRRDSTYLDVFLGTVVPFANCHLATVDVTKQKASAAKKIYQKHILLRSCDLFRTMDTILVITTSIGGISYSVRGSSAFYYTVDGKLYYTLDGGVSWDTVMAKDAPDDIWVTVPKEAFYVGNSDNKIWITRDSGNTWLKIPVPVQDTGLTWKAIGYSQRRVYAVLTQHEQTALYRIDFAPDSGVVQSVDAEPAPPPPPVHVRAVIPNPFSASVRFIIGTEPSVDMRSLSVGVYSLNGVLVADLTESYRSQTPDDRGEVTIQWDATEQPQGVYRVIVQSAQGSQSVSIVKAR